MSQILHATLVARRIGGRWLGALIRGPSGAGKSTLALRSLDAGFRLIADDRVVVFASGGRAFGKPPKPLEGLIEVRSVGVIATPDTARLSEIALVVDLVPATDRTPDPDIDLIAGVCVPRLGLALADADLPRRLTVALAALQRGL
jgi:serine kinase of HPr protein (carbohydrate metabolism regulator)